MRTSAGSVKRKFRIRADPCPTGACPICPISGTLPCVTGTFQSAYAECSAEFPYIPMYGHASAFRCICNYCVRKHSATCEHEEI